MTTELPSKSGSAPSWFVALCLFGSGFCALIYQMTWLREFRLIFGASTAASAAVLAIFMGGVGAGSIALGKKVERLGNPFRFYGHLELFIALSSALTPLLVWLVRQSYIALGGTLALGICFGTGLRLVLATFVLLVPTVLMGGTLPAVVRTAQTDDDLPRRRVALLYAINTLGGVTGALVSTFFLFEQLGNRLTLWSACVVNLVVAVAILGFTPSKGREQATPTRAAVREKRSGTSSAPAAPPGFILGASALVGFAFFLMELIWYRMLGPLLGGSTFTFGLILAVGLAGIATGGLLYALWRSGKPVTLTSFAMVCALEAGSLALPYALGDRLALLTIVLQPLGSLGFAARVAQWSVVTGIVVFPASVLAGVQFPMLIALLGQGRGAVGSHTGLTYGWNTAGAIAGALAGGFGLLPAVTAPGAWRLVVALLMLLALTTLTLSRRGQRPDVACLPPLAALAITLWLLSATGPTAVWRHSPIGAGRVEATQSSWNDVVEFFQHQRRILHWEAEGLESSVGVTCDNGYAFVVNGKVDGNARSDAPTQVLCGLLGALVQADARRSLVVGLGTGSTAGWLADVPTMERVDVAELEPAIKTVAQLCAPVNRNALANPKVHLWFGDAREIMLTSQQQYDLIASEPSNPYRAGVASLFTKQFYEAAARRLTKQGLFSQWVQAYEVDGETMSTIYATLSSVFPAVETWKTQGGDLLFIAGREPTVHDVSRLRQRLQQEPFQSAFAHVWRVTDLEGVFAHYVAHSRLADAVTTGDARVSTDDRNRLEFAFARTVGRKTGFDSEVLYSLSCERGYDKPVLKNGDLDWDQVADRRVSALMLDGEKDFDINSGTEGWRARTAAKAAFVKGEVQAALSCWRSQPQKPNDLMELMMLSYCLALQGDDQTVGCVEQLRRYEPTEADAVLAQYLWRKGRGSEAFGLMDKSMRSFRVDPWATKSMMGALMETAKIICKQPGQQPQAVRLYDLLGEPFAVKLLDTERWLARMEMAKYLDDCQLTHLTRDVVREMEPYVPWTRDFLQVRTECYGRAGDTKALAAARDLELFEEREARPFLISTSGQVALGKTRKAAPLSWNGRVYAREKAH
jgi:spermidine synthase